MDCRMDARPGPSRIQQVVAQLCVQPLRFVFQDTDDMDTHTPHRPPQALALPLHSGRFIAAFALAHVAALGMAYAAAALQAQSHGLAAPGSHAIHHLGRMTLVPLQQAPSHK
jgi:hypothetical protein